ncbi:hypothetical protein [Haemophilus parainfluenzae]|uniref:hypothetical protein n=1 Tax=Haemophilus parainfluenzae TaxID=729 RepID=UPI001A9F7800|nr:hypothetical protein [Haemophilus parainfluenzae]
MAPIASTNPKNSELATNKLIFEDIQNKPSTIPSSLGNILDSATSEDVGKELNN